MTGLFISVILFSLAGVAGTLLVGQTSPYLAGLGAVGSILYVAMLLHMPMTAALILIVVGSIVVIVIKRAEFHFDRPPLHPAMILMAFPLTMILYATAIVPLHDFDGRAFWLLKAKAIATERQIDGPFFQRQSMYDPRNQYPLLIPLDAAAVMVASDDIDDRLVRWIYPLALLAIALHARKWIGWWPAALLPWIPEFAIADDGGVMSAYNDVVIAAFAGCAFFELVERRSPLRFGFWLAFLTLTKSEGLPYAIVLFVAGVFVFGRRIATAVAPFAIAVITLLVWRSRVPSGDEENFFGRLPYLSQKLDRLLPALSRFAEHATRFDQWGPFWIATIIAAVVMIARGFRRQAVLPVYVLAALTGVYIAAYAVSVWILNDLVDSSADRLLMHLTLPALFLISRCGRSR